MVELASCDRKGGFDSGREQWPYTLEDRDRRSAWNMHGRSPSGVWDNLPSNRPRYGARQSGISGHKRDHTGDVRLTHRRLQPPSGEN
jgi:hypothetical protein